MWNVRYPGPDGTFGRTDRGSIDDTTNPLGHRSAAIPAGKDDIVTLNEITVPVNGPSASCCIRKT